MKKILKWGGIILVALFVLSLIFGGDGEKPTTDKEQSQVVFAQAPITEESVRAELQGKSESGYRVELDDITKIEVIEQAKDSEDQPDQYAVSVFYTYEAWDSEDTVKAASGTSVEIFKRLFAHPQIVRVGTFAEQDFTDQYGKTDRTTAVKYIMERETADKVDWKGVKNNVLSDYKALFPLTSTHTIHGAIQKELE